MGQMDEIVRGVRAPSRESYVDPSTARETRTATALRKTFEET
jgi:hypothetical protein